MKRTFSDTLRAVFKGVLDPIAGALNRTGITPNTVTLLGVAGNVLAGYLVARGQVSLGGLVMLMWLAAPYLASFFASPATRITSVIGWGVFIITTLQAMLKAGFVILDVIPAFLSPFAWMVLVSAFAGISLLWSVSIWRFTRRGVPRGV